MRLLRLVDDHVALEFHPYVTVLRGLDDDARAQVVESVSALPRGKVGRLTGLIESHGVVLDLDVENLGMLEMDNAEVDVVVTLERLPGYGGSSAELEVNSLARKAKSLDERLEAASAELDRHRDAITAAQAESERAVDAVRALEAQLGALDPVAPDTSDDVAERLAAASSRLSAAEAELTSLRTRLPGLEAAAVEAREHRDLAIAEGSAVAGELEGAETGLDPESAADLEAAERRLSDIREANEKEQAADAAGHTAPTDDEAVEHRLARLEVYRTELDAKLAVLGGADTLGVRAALEALSSERGDDSDLVLSADALELADDIERVEAKIAERPTGFADGSGTVMAARARLDAARQSLAEAEQRVRLPQLDRDDIDELETAHAEVLEAKEKTEGRFGGARAERRLAEAREAEDIVLARLGFEAYADYMMGTSMLHVDDEQEAALDVARSELAQAEDAWAALQEGFDSDLELETAREHLAELRAKTSALLGGHEGVDLVDRLRSHRVSAGRLDDGHVRLSLSLQSVGLAVAHEDLDPEDLVAIAEEWLEEERTANELRDAALAERAEVDLELAETRSLLSQAAAGLTGPSAEDRRKARLDDAAAARTAIKERVRRHVAAVAEVNELRAALSATTERVEAAREHASHADAAVERLRSEISDAEAAHQRASEAEALIRAEANELDPDAVEVEHAERDEVIGAHEAAAKARTAAAEQVSAARDALAASESRFAALREERREIEDELTAARSTPVAGAGESDADESASAEEVEWYLLSRLAAQRRISFAGSVPMVIDRALDVLTDDEVHLLLDRMERMAAAVQLIVISDSPAAADWVSRAGEQRGAVVEPMEPADMVPFV